MAVIPSSGSGHKVPLRDRWTTLLGHPIKVKSTPAFLANEIISHNMTNEYSHILAIGTSGCVIAGTQVTLVDGRQVPIESLGIEHRQDIDVEVMSGINGQKTKASMFFMYEDQDVVELVTETGRRIAGTHEHPLMGVNASYKDWRIESMYVQMQWRIMKDFERGDHLVIINENGDYSSEKIVEINNLPRQTVYDIEVPVDHSYIANGVVSHNSGKSTMLQLMLHELHTRHPYQIHFFYKKDILKLAGIIKTLQKRIDHIIIFDDVSYLFKAMSPEQVEELMHQLTTIRHEVQAKVVSIFIIHYSYAILKGLRQADFRLVTSMTDEEKENFVKVFGPLNRPLISKFADDYRMETLYQKFYLPGPNGHPYEFHTKEPFKLSMVSVMGKLRYMLFYKLPEPCTKCTPPIHKRLKPADVNVIQAMIKRYGPNRVKRMAGLVSFMNTGESGMGHTDKIVYNQLQKFVSEHNINLMELKNLLRDSKHAPIEEREEFILRGLDHLAGQAAEKKKIVPIPESELQTTPEDPELHTDEANAKYMTDEEIQDNIEAAEGEEAVVTADKVTQEDQEQNEEEEEDEDDDEEEFPMPSLDANKEEEGDEGDNELFHGVNFKMGDWKE